MPGVKGCTWRKLDNRTVAKARKLWDAGLSASAIGAQMGRTKSSIIGMARRNGFTPRPNPIKPADARAVERAVQPTRPIILPAPPKPRIATVPALLPVESPVPRTIFKPRAATACCWPFGDPKAPDFRFCDATSLPGKPYCAEHCRKAYRRPDEPSAMPAGAPVVIARAVWSRLRLVGVE